MGKRRDDDHDDDDFGLRTHTRKLSNKKTTEPSRKESGKRKRDTGRTKRRESGKHRSAERKRESGKHRSAERKRETGRTKRATGKHERVEKSPPSLDRAISEKLPRIETPPRPGSKGPPLALLAGVVFVGGIGGMIAMIMTADDAPKQVEISKKPESGFLIVDAPPTRESAPAINEFTPVLVEPDGRPIKPAGGEEISAPAETIDLEEDALEELAKKSSTHAAVARILKLFNELHDPSAMLNSGPLAEHFRERQKREDELIEQLRAMGPTAVDALKDILLGVDRRQYRIFLGKALSGIEGPGALEAVKEILAEVKDVALQTTMVRYLPENRDSTDAVASLIGSEENANLRTMLMREYHRRLGDDMESGRDLFRTAALDDPNANVRAEAVTIIGRRGDPRDMSLMEDIISNESNLSIRQRAIVSYAETGKASSLSFLEQLVRNPDTALPVGASAVLAIGRIGGQSAVQSLDLIAQTHQTQEIRTRANRLAQSLRRRAAEKNDPKRVDRRPMRVDPVPLRRSN